ncbi:MAG: hypothetical protein J0I12_15970 [Candidatus Eremiobacteraeota bacterium]|nr:hypothetical protein [Candidatus Eremiobacteraeota bacterium]
MRHFRKGIALVLTLSMATLMALLCGALLNINRSSLNLMATSRERQNGYQVCLTGLDYVRGRLASDATYGTVAFAPATTMLLPGKLEIREKPDRIEGDDLTAESHFEARVVNNLAGNSAMESVEASWRRLNLPSHSCLVVLQGRCGQARRRLEVVLQRGQSFRGPLNANGSLALRLNPSAPDLDKVRFHSNEPLLNAVRANGDLLLPLGSQMEFGATEASGRINGRDDVNVGGQPIMDSQGRMTGVTGGSWLKDNATLKETTENESKSLVGIGQSQTVPKLSAGDVKRGSGGTHSLPGGLYAFSDANTVSFFSDPHADPDTATPTRVFHGVIYNGASDSGTPDQEAVYLKDGRFIPSGRVEASADMVVGSTSGVPPQMALGYSREGTLDEAAPGASSLEVKGNLTVAGDVAGNGSLLTTGHGDLTINGRSELSAAPDQATTLFAEGAIKLEPVPASANSAPDAFLPIDFRVLRQVDVDYEPFTHLHEWGLTTPSKRREYVGSSDSSLSSSIRDSSLPNYTSTIASQIPGWPSTTPGGHPLPSAASNYISDLLSSTHTSSPPYNDTTGMSIGRHLRLREYIKSVDAGHPDANWLNLHEKNDEVTDRLVNLYTMLDRDAKHHGFTDMKDWWNSPQAFALYGGQNWRDIKLRGLVYAGDFFHAVGNHRFTVEGAIAAATGSLTIRNISAADFTFNSDQLKSLIPDNSGRFRSVLWLLD